jgi:ribosomal 50S subunit-recycling heat shock protein
VSPKTDRDIVRAIASSLKPTGNFILAGQPTLVFGQKRVKAGSLLTITFEGTEYTLEITAIERTSFTLRLNREEFTRPIK